MGKAVQSEVFDWQVVGRPRFRRQIRNPRDLFVGLHCILMTDNVGPLEIVIHKLPTSDIDGLCFEYILWPSTTTEGRRISLEETNLAPYPDSNDRVWAKNEHLRRYAWIPLFDKLLLEPYLANRVRFFKNLCLIAALTFIILAVVGELSFLFWGAIVFVVFWLGIYLLQSLSN